jgi:hypothetical protein
MIESRYYTINGIKWEARFFQKGNAFPDTTAVVSRQGVWARPVGSGWEQARFIGSSWKFVRLDSDVFYLPERK